MTVFRGFLLIAKRNTAMFVTYLVVFFIMCLLFDLSAPSPQPGSLQKSSVAIGIVDLDQSELSRGLSEYLSGTHHVTPLADDKAVMQESLLYRDIVYLITVPAGFQDSLPHVPPLDVTKVCENVEEAVYVGQMISWYLMGAQALCDAGYSISEIIPMLADCADMEADVSILSATGNLPVLPAYAAQYVALPYVILAITGFTLGTITMEFYKLDILRRLRVSTISSWRRNIEFLFGYLVFGLVIWAFFNLVPLLLHSRPLLNDPNLPWHLANSFALVLTCLGMTSILGLWIRKQEVLTATVNIVTLGMSFLCGVFVSLDILSDKLTIFSRFLPIYWYEVVVNILLTKSVLSQGDLSAVLSGIGLQLLFSAVFIALSLVLGRIRSQEA